MSAPPRTHIVVRPLRGRMKSKARHDPTSTPGGHGGLHHVATLCVDQLIRTWFPGYRLCDTDPDTAVWVDDRPRERPDVEFDHLRLRCLVLLSRLAVGTRKRITRRSVVALAAHSPESLETEYLDNVAQLDPRELGAPPIGIVRRCGEKTDSHNYEKDPARALALLSRIAGSVFSAERSPVLVDHLRHYPPVTIYAFNRFNREARHD